MTMYKTAISDLKPSETLIQNLELIPETNSKPKNFKLKKSIVIAVITTLILTFSCISAYAAEELYGWQKLENDIHQRGGTVISRYYSEEDGEKKVKCMEYEYDSIYYHIKGKAYLQGSLVISKEEGELEEEYKDLFEDDRGVMGINAYANGN